MQDHFQKYTQEYTEKNAQDGLKEEPEPWWKKPFTIIISLFLILMLIVWYFPSQAVKIDPDPTYIPNIEEVVPKIEDFQKTEIYSAEQYPSLIDPSDPVIKQVADRIVSLSCDGSKVCHAKALYYFVIQNFQYVSDPNRYEYVKSAKESLTTLTGDCDDASVLLANLLEAVGIRTRFVFIPGHVYVQAYLPEAVRRYKSEDSEYVSLDPTCSNCRFGELPFTDMVDQKRVIG